MSSKKYAAPLQIEVRSSRLLLMLFSCLHLVSFLLLFLMPLPIELTLFCVIFIVISGIYVVVFHALKHSSASIVGLVWDRNDDWLVLDKSGKQWEVVLDGNSFVHPWFSILNFKQENKWLSQSVMLLSDNVDKNDYRRLRVRLRVTRNNPDSSASA